MATSGEGRLIRARRHGLIGLAILSLGGVAGPSTVSSAQAQGLTRPIPRFHPDDNFDAERLLRNAASQAKGGQWSEALNLYQRVISQYSDKVAKVPAENVAHEAGGAGEGPRPDSVLYIDTREYCQRQIAALPAEARAIYRNRVDPRAERWFREAAAHRDRAPLRQIISEAFCSSWGDDALELLGDLAFQDGDFAEALLYYRRLVPDSSGVAPGLVHPDPSVDRAKVAAKALLCRSALGENQPSATDLRAFREAYPNAAGPFAGREGSLADVLEQALAQDHLPIRAALDSRWTTFAGSPQRTKVAPNAINVGSLQWRVQPPAVNVNQRPYQDVRMGGRFQPMAPIATITHERLLAYHPIVLGDQVVFCDENRMVSIPLNVRPRTDGGLSDIDSILLWEQKLTSPETQTARSNVSVPRFTLTAAGDRIFARLGPAGRASGVSSTIVAVRNTSGDKRSEPIEGKLLWRVNATDILPSPPQQPQARTVLPSFEGTPVADLQNVYVGLTVAGPMTATYVVCLDAERGVTRWIRKAGEASGAIDAFVGLPNGVEIGHRLLSLDGPTVYYQTNMGAVVALEASTGAVRWIATYPSQDPAVDVGRSSFRTTRRDLNPAIVHGGLVIVAPEDTPAIFAFHAATGRLAWKNDDAKLASVIHLLGVAKGRLFATGDHVFSLNVKTGKVETFWPEGQGMPGFGRGVLAGEYIYWPTRDDIRILDQSTGRQSDRSDPISLAAAYLVGGNLTVGDGYLVVAGLDKNTVLSQPPNQRIVVFCQNSRWMQRLDQEIAQGHDPGPNSLLYARAAEAEGQDDEALRALGNAIRLAKPTDMLDGEDVAKSARKHRYRLLMRLGVKALDVKDWTTAGTRFDDAAAAALFDKDRLAARLRQADAQSSAGEPRLAVATLQGVLADYQMRGLTVASDDGQRSMRADLLASDRLAALIKQHGRVVYAEYDRQASELLRQGRDERSPRVLEAIGPSFPVASIVPDALLALAAIQESLDRPAEASKAYKRLLALPAAGDPHRARALCGLARSYESQSLWIAAREMYTRALTRYPDAKLEELGAGATVASFASGQLAKEPLSKLSGNATEPYVPVPLTRRWERSWSNTVRPLTAEGSPPSPDASQVFLVERTTIRPLDPRTGNSAWRYDLKSEPIWVAYLADRVLVASTSRLVSLGVAKGDVGWEFDGNGARATQTRLNPFAPREPIAQAVETPRGPLHGYRVQGARVFCFRGDKEFFAVDGDTGQVDWSYSPSAGTLGPHGVLTARRIVLQVRRPNSSSVLVFDTDTGRSREFRRPDDEQDWARAPLPVDEDHFLLAPDNSTIVLLDATSGKSDWVYHHRPLLRLAPNAAPRLWGDSGRLMVLFDGNEVVRLNPINGESLWTTALGGEDLSDSPDSCAIDADRFYCASGSILTAYDVADGKPVWRRYLIGAESGWSLALTERGLAAYPNPSQAPDKSLDILPLAFFRRNDGRLLQRLVFASVTSELTVGLAPKGALVATQANVWALGERTVMDSAAPSR
jgi:cellulose synthase operon protein C